MPPAAYAIAGSPCAVFMAGIKYRSIYDAAGCAGIAPTWVTRCLVKSGGGPVVIRNQFIVTEFWCRRRIEGLSHE